MLKLISARAICLYAILIFSLVACTSGGGSPGSAEAIEAYLQALVAKDVNQLVNASCSTWESQARQELNSFSAVQVTLEDLSCQETGQEGETAHVSCNGKIIANYGNEILEINLADRGYQAFREAGDWRMCGYQ